MPFLTSKTSSLREAAEGRDEAISLRLLRTLYVLATLGIASRHLGARNDEIGLRYSLNDTIYPRSFTHYAAVSITLDTALYVMYTLHM